MLYNLRKAVESWVENKMVALVVRVPESTRTSNVTTDPSITDNSSVAKPILSAMNKIVMYAIYSNIKHQDDSMNGHAIILVVFKCTKIALYMLSQLLIIASQWRIQDLEKGVPDSATPTLATSNNAESAEFLSMPSAAG